MLKMSLKNIEIIQFESATVSSKMDICETKIALFFNRLFLYMVHKLQYF